MSTSDNKKQQGPGWREPENIPRSRTEDERMESALSGFRLFAREALNRPENFWEQQRRSVEERLHEDRARRGYNRMAWVSAAALVLLALALFTPRGEPVAPDIPAGQDQELLIGVERSLDRNVPQALEPGLLLTQEIQKAEVQSVPK